MQEQRFYGALSLLLRLSGIKLEKHVVGIIGRYPNATIIDFVETNWTELSDHQLANCVFLISQSPPWSERVLAFVRQVKADSPDGEASIGATNLESLIVAANSSS